jgi:hypothetical protein
MKQRIREISSHYKKYDFLWHFYLWWCKICHKMISFMMNFIRQIWSMTKKMFIMKVSLKRQKLVHYKTMMIFLTIIRIIITLAELDSLTGLDCWHGYGDRTMRWERCHHPPESGYPFMTLLCLDPTCNYWCSSYESRHKVDLPYGAHRQLTSAYPLWTSG